jgi:hypothetical protein
MLSLPAIVRLIAVILALCATMIPAQAAETPDFTKPTIAAEPITISVQDAGAANLSGAYVESDYVAPHGRPSATLQALGLIDAAHGRDDFNEALVYLKQSPRALALLNRIEASDIRISVVINHRCDDRQRMGPSFNSIIHWDPSCAYRIGNGSNSPSLVLLHELVHTLHLAENARTYLDNGQIKDDQFDDREERRTILYGEIPVARELGEAVRDSHDEYRPFRVYDPTVR